MAGVAIERRIADPALAALLADLKRRLEHRFGERFVALYLFGSRARGDHEEDSDVDVAVILDQKLPRSFEVTRDIIDDTYDLLLETGFYIQPWALEKGSLEEPSAHPHPRISRALQRDGIRIND